MLKKNLGNVDRAIRIVVGLGILSLVFIGPMTYWGFLGLVPLVTGIVGFCPAYCPLGIKTCRVSANS